MQFYIIRWHEKDGRLSGSDLVYARNKRHAKQLYKKEHYSPISQVISEEESYSLDRDMSAFLGVTEEEFERAKRGEVVELEVGT